MPKEFSVKCTNCSALTPATSPTSHTQCAVCFRGKGDMCSACMLPLLTGRPLTLQFNRRYHAQCLQTFHTGGMGTRVVKCGLTRLSPDVGATLFVPPPPPPPSQSPPPVLPPEQLLPSAPINTRASMGGTTPLESLVLRAIAMGLFHDRPLRPGVMFRKCIEGRAFVSFLSATGVIAERWEGVTLGQALLDAGVLLTSPSSATPTVFEDRGALYSYSPKAFPPPPPPPPAPTEVAVSSMGERAPWMESHSESFLDSTLPQDAQDEWESSGDALQLQSPRPPPVIPSPADATKTTSGSGTSQQQQQQLISTPLAVKAQGGATSTSTGGAGFLSSVWSALRRASFSTPTTSTGGEGEVGGVPHQPTNALHQLLQTPTQPPPLPPKTPASTLARLSAYEAKVWQVGWLYKEGHVRKNWKRRWFVLRGWSLQYFRRGPRSEGAAEAAVREAMDGASASGLGGGRSALELLSAMLPPNKEPPAGVIDIRAFTLESGAHATLTPKLAVRLSNRVEGGGDFVLVAESEQSFVNWVKVLAITIMEWEKIQRD